MINLDLNKRALLYSAILTLGIYLLVHIRPESSLTHYIVALAINLLIFMLELYTIITVSSVKLEQMGLPKVNRYSYIQTTIYHKFLPLILFASFNIFIFFNPINFMTVILFLTIFLSFSILFINIRAYFEDKFKLEMATHFIYVFSVIFGIFSLSNAVLNIASIYDINLIFVIAAIFVLVIISFLILFIEKLDLDPVFYLLIIVASLISTAIAISLFEHFESVLRTSFMLATCFYLFGALIHHKQDGTLQKFVLLEYTIILSLSFVLLYGIK